MQTGARAARRLVLSSSTVTSLPPPTDAPATGWPRPDPWAEQLQRRDRHRRRRRRRLLRWAVPVAAVVTVAVSAGAVLVVRSLGGPEGQLAGDVPPPTTTVPPPPPTVPPTELVDVEELWLLDRQDGSFDWGIVVVAPPDAGRRSGVAVDVRLVTAAGEVVHRASDVLAGVSATSPGALAGRAEDLVDVPVRIEFDVTVGHPSTEPSLGELLDVRAVDRDGDVLTGRVRSAATEDLVDLRLVLVWRSDGRSEVAGEVVPAGEVIATVVHDVGRIRPEVEARFELELDTVVPAREPDDVYWVH